MPAEMLSEMESDKWRVIEMTGPIYCGIRILLK